MPTRRLDLACVVLSFVALAATTVLSEHVGIARPLRLLLGIVCALVLPGYSATAALFPRRDDLDSWERAAMSIGLSLAALPLVAVVLDRLPWRLSPLSIGLSLGLWTCAWAAVAWRRGHVGATHGGPRLMETGEPCRPSQPSQTKPTTGGRMGNATVSAHRVASWANRPRFSANGVFLSALGVGAAGALLSIASLNLPRPASPTTEFSIVGPGGLARDYPRRAVVGRPVEVVVGIANQEGVAASYRVEARQSGQVIGRMGPVSLRPAAAGEWTASFVPNAPGTDVAVALVLYRDGGASPYRTTRLWLETIEP